MTFPNLSFGHYGATVALIILPNMSAQAAEHPETLTWQGHVSAGYQYDTNVNIRELDTNTDNADRAWLMKAALSAKWKPIQALSVKAGISHSDQRYATYDNFNVVLTTVHADVSYDFKPFTVGVSRHQADAKLAGDHFMQYRQDTLYASRLWSTQWYSRIEWREIDKNFANVNERNATAQAYSGDLYWFTSSAQSFIAIGYGVHDETAENPQYSYDGDEVRVTWQTRSVLGGHEHLWQLGWQRSNRDYQKLPEGTTARNDQRQSVRAQWQIPLFDALQLMPHIEYIDNDSNISSADYHESVAALSMRFSF